MSGGLGSSTITAAAWETAMAQVRSLAWELLYAVDAVKNKQMGEGEEVGWTGSLGLEDANYCIWHG